MATLVGGLITVTVAVSVPFFALPPAVMAVIWHLRTNIVSAGGFWGI